MSIRYLSIERMSGCHGPGLRTALVLKGCSLACKWCSAPESIQRKRQIIWSADRCVGCQSCLDICPNSALSMESDGLKIDRRRCDGCFACADICPAKAIIPLGIDAEPQDLMQELLKDRAYFGADGGVTLAGGEALLQEDAFELLRLLSDAHIHTAVETSGMLFPEQLERALPHTDILLFDLKLLDDNAHRRFTGQSNTMILRNLGIAAKWAKGTGRLWIRTPIVPGVTDSAENIRAIGERIAALGCVECWELCAFDSGCAEQYARLDLHWPYAGEAPVSESRMDALLVAAAATGACHTIRFSGPVCEANL